MNEKLKKVKVAKSNSKFHNSHRTSQNSGITLVALIITIIVLLILAVVAIRAVQGDGIISHAKNARDQYELAQANEQTKLDSLLEHIEGNIPQETVVHSGVVPKGAVYTTGRVYNEDNDSFDETNLVTLNEGDKMPDEPQLGDMYIYGDYKYIYEGWFYPGGYGGNNTGSSEAGRWDAQVIDKTKSKYGDILLSINNKPLRKGLQFTWYDCVNITKLVIPEGVTTTNGICNGNDALKTLTIPSSFERVTLYRGIDGSSIEDIYYDGTIAEFEKILNNSFGAGPGWGDTLNCTLHLSDGSSVVINYELETKRDESGNNISQKYVSKS